MKVPRDNATGFAAIVAIAAVLLGIVFDFVVSAARLGLGLRG
jgi:hypothetical protein